MVICSDTLILLCLQKEQPGHRLFCSFSLRNKGKKKKKLWLCHKNHKYLLFLKGCEIISLSRSDCPSCLAKSQAMGFPSQVLQPKNTFTNSIYFFSDMYSIAMLLVFTALYIKLNNTSSSWPVSELGAKSLHPIHLPSQTPASKGALWRRFTTKLFIYTVQNLQHSVPRAIAHYKQSIAHRNYN